MSIYQGMRQAVSDDGTALASMTARPSTPSKPECVGHKPAAMRAARTGASW
jgi:hypothetical protein